MPALATRMLTRALDAGVPAGWVTGDEVYEPPGPPVISTTDCAGQHGDAGLEHAPAPATTNDKQPGNHEDHDLRLEY